MTEEHAERKRTEQKNPAAFYRLCVSLAILGAALISRAFFPEQTRSFLHNTVSGGWDYTALLGGAGDRLRSFVLGVPHPDSLEIAAEEDSTAATDGPPYVNRELEETYDPEHEPPPDDDRPSGGLPIPAEGMGGFDLPVMRADARLFLSEFDGEDDTFPLPFGMQKPERVDYTVYDLPFETALPAAGRLTSAFGYRIHPIYGDWRFHFGIDIANAAGTPILAFADGTVSATGRSNGYGNYVILEHEGGFYTLYAHCRTVDVRAGRTVERGQKIASVGSTGVTTGPHLHFELRYGDAFLDPERYLSAVP